MGGRLGTLAFVSAIAGTPGLLLCGFHVCRGGHMAHPPCAWWHNASDWSWPFLFLVGAIAGVLTGRVLPTLLSVFLLWGLAYRFVPTVSYWAFLVTIPLALSILVLCAVGPARRWRALAHQVTT
jgi:hypothetical protein